MKLINLHFLFLVSLATSAKVGFSEGCELYSPFWLALKSNIEPGQNASALKLIQNEIDSTLAAYFPKEEAKKVFTELNALEGSDKLALAFRDHGLGRPAQPMAEAQKIIILNRELRGIRDMKLSPRDGINLTAFGITPAEFRKAMAVILQKFGSIRDGRTVVELITAMKHVQRDWGPGNEIDWNHAFEEITPIRRDLEKPYDFKLADGQEIKGMYPFKEHTESSLRLAAFAFRLKAAYQHKIDFQRMARASFIAGQVMARQFGGREADPFLRDEMMKSIYLLDIQSYRQFEVVDKAARAMHPLIASAKPDTVIDRAIGMRFLDSPDFRKEAMFP